jgi:ribosomal protein S18 acetylase RimI-like enzyme
MSLYKFTTNGFLPFVPSPAGLQIKKCNDAAILAAMAGTTLEEVNKRLSNEHVAFVAFMNNVPAAFGWMARSKAFIGELNHEVMLPTGNRYLWNFRTMEAFRGKGIYPALLRHIIQSEEKRANTFWIIHAPENTASLRGIQKAGFEYVGRIYSNNGKATIEATTKAIAARNELEKMQISISKDQPASCWNCSSPYLKKRKDECCCFTVNSDCIGNNLQALRGNVAYI